MAGMMIKMFVCVIAVFIYWLLMKDKFSKFTVFAAMILYLIYLAVEVRLVTAAQLRGYHDSRHGCVLHRIGPGVHAQAESR